MNKNKSIAKNVNAEDSNQEREGLIKIIKISDDLEMVKDERGVIYPSDVLYFLVPKGSKVRHSLRDAMEFLKTQKNMLGAVLKYKEFEVSFGRDEKFADILGYIYTIEDFMKSNTYQNNPNYTLNS